MKKIVLSALLAVTTCNLFAQSDFEPINTGAANFLTLPSDARTVGIGCAGVGLASGNAFCNGATVLFDGSTRTKSGVSYSYTPWMRGSRPGNSQHTLSGFHIINPKNAVYAGVRYYNHAKVEEINDGTPSGKYTRPGEWAVDLGYTGKVMNNLALSGTVRFIHSDMGDFGGAKAANGIAFDVGAMYGDAFSIIDGAKWGLGMSLTNLGTNLKYLERSEKLPMTGKVGGSVYLPVAASHTILAAADLGYRLSPSDAGAVSVSAGLEYTLLDHFIFRGGYRYGDKNKADQSFATAGLGLACKWIKIDFAWIFAEKSLPINNTFSISCSTLF